MMDMCCNLGVEIETCISDGGIFVIALDDGKGGANVEDFT